MPPRTEQNIDAVFEDARPASVSSEVFATPSPSPPHETKLTEGAKGTDDDNTLTRAQVDPAGLSNKELAEIINRPVFLDSSIEEASITTVKTTSKTPAMALPPSWKFRATPDSDCDDDFVESEMLDEMLKQARAKTAIKDEDNDFVASSDLQAIVRNTKKQGNNGMSQSSPGPPLPPRKLPSVRVKPHLSKGESHIVPPPLPPRNYGMARSPESFESTATAGPGLRRSIYDTLGRDASLDMPSSMCIHLS